MSTYSYQNNCNDDDDDDDDGMSKNSNPFATDNQFIQQQSHHQHHHANNNLDQMSFFPSPSATSQSSSKMYKSYQNQYQHQGEKNTAEERLQQQLRETYSMMMHNNVFDGGDDDDNNRRNEELSKSGDKSDTIWSQNGNIPISTPIRPAQHPRIHSYHSNNANNRYSTDRVPTVAQIGLPEAVMRLRGINLGICGTATLFGLLSLATFVLTLSLHKLVMAAYLSFFSCLMCGYETHTAIISDAIKDNFGFMYNSQHRTCFIFVMSTMCFQIGGIGWLLGIGMFWNGLFHSYIIYKYGSLELEDQQMSVGSEDITTILANKVGIGMPQPPWTTIHDSNTVVSSYNQQRSVSETEVLINSGSGGGYSVIQ